MKSSAKTPRRKSQACRRVGMEKSRYKVVRRITPRKKAGRR